MIQTHGKNGRVLKHKRVDWIADPIGCGLPQFTQEYRFNPTRKWALDYAWPLQRVALEIDGAAGSYGRHSRPAGMRSDFEKINDATLRGWMVFRVLRGEELRLSTFETLKKALTNELEEAA